MPAVDVFLKAPGAVNSAANRVAARTFRSIPGFLVVPSGTYDAWVGAVRHGLAGVLNLNGAALAARVEHQRVRHRPAERQPAASRCASAAYADDRAPIAGQAARCA
ncbi:MAG: hypothetical protein MZW92_39820 [Comamonadaceae bacterium]|nr:hypothetical protein [Comamonadaceae bacterium]